MSGKIGLAAVLASVAALGSVPSMAASPEPTPASSSIFEMMFDAAAADNAFGFGLLRAVQKDHPHANVVLSPVSAGLDLAMALNGATGETAAQMQKTLALEGVDLAAINSANSDLIKILRTPATDVTLSVANAIYADQHRAPLRDAFVSEVKKWYDSEVANLDFRSAQAPGVINGWADKETHGKIPKIVDSIDPNEVTMLLNAIYFKGQWTHKFDKSNTHNAGFTLESGAALTVPRMSQSGKFDYFETQGMQAIRLPYGKGDLAMIVLLPSKPSGLEALEVALNLDTWKSWDARLSSQQGTIELPRFELKNTYDLNRPLEALGMVRAFDPRAAQFSKMSSTQISISDVKQFTYLKVDEEGSEAAAVTSIGMVAMAMPRPTQPFHMIVDHPFLCAIEDRRSHALLFIGAIYDPRA